MTKKQNKTGEPDPIGQPKPGWESNGKRGNQDPNKRGLQKHIDRQKEIDEK